MPNFDKVFNFAGSLKTEGYQSEYKTVIQEHFAENATEEQIEALNSLIREQAGDAFKAVPKEQQEARKALNQAARDSLFDITGKFAALKSLEVNGHGRDTLSLMCFNKDPEQNEKENQEIRRILTEGTAEEQRQFFYDTMNRIAKLDPEVLANCSDEYLVQNLNTIIPIVNIGVEGENLIGLFKSLKFQMTEEEEQQFRNLTGALNDIQKVVNAHLNVITSPYYIGVDLMAIADYPARAKDAIIEELGKEYYDSDDLAESFLPRIAGDLQNLPCQDIVSQSLVLMDLPDSKARNISFSPSPDRERHSSPRDAELTYDTFDALDALKAGKTVFVYDEKDPNGPVKAVRDLNGNGHFTEVPYPAVEKPGIFTRFRDSVMRFFGSKTGVKECRDYEQYEAGMKAAVEASKNHKRFPKFGEVKETLKTPADTLMAKQDEKLKKKISAANNEKSNLRTEMLNQTVQARAQEKDRIYKIRSDYSNPDSIAKTIIHEFHKSMEVMRSEKEFTVKNAACLAACDEILSDIKLKGLAENHAIDKNELAEFQGRKQYANIWEKNLDAECALLNAAKTGKNLSPKAKANYLADMAVFRLVQLGIDSKVGNERNTAYTALNNTKFDEIKTVLKNSATIKQMSSMPENKLAGISINQKDFKSFGDNIAKDYAAWQSKEKQNQKKETMDKKREKVNEKEANELTRRPRPRSMSL